MITIKSEELSKALNIVTKAVSQNTVTPILNNILFDASEKFVKMNTTNYEISIEYKIPVTSKVKFKTTIPADILSRLSSRLYDDSIKMEYENNEIKVITKNSNNKISCIQADEYPLLDRPKGKYITASIKKLRDAVMRVEYAARKSDKTSLLFGTQLLTEGSNLSIISMDGNRLSYDSILVKNKDKVKMDSIVKSSTLEIATRILDSNDSDDVKIYSSKDQVHFVAKNIIIACQIIDGNMPDYKQLVPKEKAKIIVSIDTVKLLRACNQLEVFMDTVNYISLDVNLKNIKMFTVKQQRGDSEITLNANIKSSNEINIRLNLFFIKQFLEVCSSENIVIELTEDKRPVVFKMENNKKHFYIVMPMAV